MITTYIIITIIMIILEKNLINKDNIIGILIWWSKYINISRYIQVYISGYYNNFQKFYLHSKNTAWNDTYWVSLGPFQRYSDHSTQNQQTK